MTKKSDAPAIRFKGFSDAWEQRKLGELVDRVVRKNTNNESTLPLTISAQYGLVDQITYFNNRVASRDVSNYYLVLNGEFAYNKSTSDGYPFGAVKRLDLYEKGVLSTLYIVFAPKKEQQIDSDYLTVFFDTDRWHKGVAERAAEGARNHGLLNISAEDFFDIDLSVPKDIVEQKQIGAFIRQLDNLITLHQRKFEKLTNVKKSMLEKMFPQNGSSYPEIRFKGFTDPWEQRKLGELIRLNGRIGFRGYTEKDIVSKDDGGVLAFSPTNIVDNKLTTNCKNTYITRFKYDESPEIKIHNGDILFVKTGSTLGKSALVTGLLEDATLNPQVVVMRTNKADAEFLAAMLITNHIISQVNSAKIGGAVPTLTETRIKDFDVAIPASEVEKEQIGQFFTRIDNLITLHQRELEKLQNIKKSMLEKMFV